MSARLSIPGLAGIAAAGLLAAALVAPTVTLANEKVYNYRGPDRQKMLEEGARKEGRLVIYSALIVNQLLRPITEAFQKKYPFIETKYWRGSSGKIIRKVTGEIRAGALVASVIEGSGLAAQLEKAKIAAPFYSPIVEEYPEQYRDPDRLWATDRFRYLALAYNTKMVSKADVPQTMEDFLDPKWKGKIAWRAGTSSSGAIVTITTLRLAWGEDKAIAYLKKLAAQEPVPLHISNRAVVNRVVEGEYPLAIAASAHHPLISKRKGAPTDAQLIEPVTALNGTVSVLKNAPHPHAAMLMLEFIISKEGQSLFSKKGYLPAHPAVEPPKDLLPTIPSRVGKKEFFLSPKALDEATPKSVKLFKQIFK